MIDFLAKLQRLDRRWLYAVTLIVVFVPIIIPVGIPDIAVAPATRDLYNAIENCPEDGIVLIDSSWDAGSLAENQAQLRCVVRHLCQRKIRFVVTSVGITALGPDFAWDTIQPIAKKHGYVYGRDWVNAGFVQGVEGSIGAIITGVCEDFRGTFPVDAFGTPMERLPLMQGFEGVKDENAYLVYVITYAPAPEWISWIYGQYNKPLAFGAMSIMAPVYYNNYQANQLKGLLLGNRAAAEYEQLLGAPGQGTRLAIAGSFGSMAVIAAAILGNVAWWAGRQRGRRRS